MVITAAEEVLLKASSFIGKITLASFTHYKSPHSQGGVESSQDPQRESMSRSLSHALSALNAVSEVMRHVAQCSLLKAPLPSSSGASSLSVFTAVEALGEEGGVDQMCRTVSLCPAVWDVNNSLI